MEVDGVEESNVKNHPDGAKFTNLKAFVNAAREFEATHSESAINLMTRYLGLIASSCDLSIFSPGRIEVCAFFSSLWRVMRDARGPHWAGVAVLTRACIEPSARHALTHTYKFIPILAKLLSDTVSNDKKIKLLSVMQDISHGIKISWQECYLPRLMKQLTEWITQPILEPQHRTIGHKSLTVLVNVCYGNLPAIYALMRTVDTKNFVNHLITLKDGGYGGVEVCRLLLCLSNGTRGSANTRQPDVTHSYLSCTMKTFNKAIVERDATQLLHAYTFINDLCSDSDVKSFVLTYPDFSTALHDSLKNIDELCKLVPDDTGEPGASCLRHVLKFITVLVNLDLYSLRSQHCQLVCLCMKASRTCLPDSLELFAAIVSQYRDEGTLPRELSSVISDGLPALLVPPALEPGKAGLQWLQVVGALCESCETQERVLHEVTPDSFEDTLYSVLQYTSQNGPVGTEAGAQCVVVACRAGLALAPLSRHWEAAFTRMLAHHQVRKLLCAGLASNNGTRRRQILQIIKHHYFPSDQMNQIFGESLHNISDVSVESVSPRVDTDSESLCATERLTPSQELVVNDLIARLNDALQAGKINDIATSSAMELYGYKMTCLEQRLHSHAVTLQSATEHTASLQHALALMQATNSSQQDVLYTTQMQNEKYKRTIEELHKQLEDAEKTLQSFRAKLAGERLDKENQKEALHKEFRSQIASIESEMKAREREMEERSKQMELDNRAVQKKLEQQANKNSELASVLIKFEERVKHKDKKLEEAAAAEAVLRRELEQKDNMIKQLEKTVVERENRLYQVTSQMEEMKRVQEMVAKLMSKSTSTAAS
ncbi:protein CIP2A isoform X1 [Maniola hyperantus]|uniref:protein CIP2A isoform X1 n=1 Tax=Aphantopus hyperantus TaxID=2795564 RepID=UPI0015697709|nr:protein CIP2A homolog [Maniola hyperantus]